MAVQFPLDKVIKGSRYFKGLSVLNFVFDNVISV